MGKLALKLNGGKFFSPQRLLWFKQQHHNLWTAKNSTNDPSSSWNLGYSKDSEIAIVSMLLSSKMPYYKCHGKFVSHKPRAERIISAKSSETSHYLMELRVISAFWSLSSLKVLRALASVENKQKIYHPSWWYRRHHFGHHYSHPSKRKKYWRVAILEQRFFSVFSVCS